MRQAIKHGKLERCPPPFLGFAKVIVGERTQVSAPFLPPLIRSTGFRWGTPGLLVEEYSLFCQRSSQSTN
jgi:hypothetical protein